MTGCMCIWDEACSGTGVLHCVGCGGDFCICRCGGETSCDGCEMCGDGSLERDLDDDEVAQ